jgi:hypothetical protein
MKPCVLYFRKSWCLWLSLVLVFICLVFRASMVFVIEKACVLVAALEFGNWYLPSL